jgi:PIN domain nuclease of toxin-antitoxin system
MIDMPLLLDTCIVYDWLMGQVSDYGAIDLIQSQGAYVSPITVWEMAIKHALGKLDLPSTDLVDDIAEQGFAWLNITARHAQDVLHLEHHHRDPFDRFLIAQAQRESMRIMTYDKVIVSYLPETLIVRR